MERLEKKEPGLAMDNGGSGKENDVVSDSTLGTSPALGFWTRMGCTPESFKQRTLEDRHNQFNQTLKSRHLHMIAIGGSIGAGLFVGSGSALRAGGPGALVIDFAIAGMVSWLLSFILRDLNLCTSAANPLPMPYR